MRAVATGESGGALQSLLPFPMLNPPPLGVTTLANALITHCRACASTPPRVRGSSKGWDARHHQHRLTAIPPALQVKGPAPDNTWTAINLRDNLPTGGSLGAFGGASGAM